MVLDKQPIKCLAAKLFVAVFIIWTCFYTSARAGQSATDNDNLAKGKELFLKGREIIYNIEKLDNKALLELGAAEKSFDALDEGFTKYYWLAQVKFMQSKYYDVAEDGEEVIKKCQESNQLIIMAMEYNENVSDAYRLQADIYMRLVKYKGKLFALTNGKKIPKLLDKAIKLDKQNYRAYSCLAGYYLYAPSFAGGSIDKAIDALNKSLESNDQFDDFLSYSIMGIAYKMKKDKVTALKYFDKALEVYPHNAWVKSLKSSN